MFRKNLSLKNGLNSDQKLCLKLARKLFKIFYFQDFLISEISHQRGAGRLIFYHLDPLSRRVYFSFEKV